MGASSSSTKPSRRQSDDLHDLEARLAASRDLPSLQHVFASLSQSTSASPSPAIPFSSLQEALDFPTINIKQSSTSASSHLPKFIQCVGLSIAQAVFEPGKKDIDWIKFLKAYEDLCKKSLGATKLKNLLIFLCQLNKSAQLSTGFDCTSQAIESCEDVALEGLIAESQVRDFLFLCWLMTTIQILQKVHDDAFIGNLQIELPDVESLVRASIVDGDAGRITDHVATKESVHTDDHGREIPFQGLFSWLLETIPGVSNALPQYVQDQFLQNVLIQKGKNESSEAFLETPQSFTHSSKAPREGSKSLLLLSFGRAWAVGLSLKDEIGAKLVKASGSIHESLEDHINLLYSSSIHGKGMNQLWIQVEGYKGPVLMLFSAKSSQMTTEDVSQNAEKNNWVLGFFIPEGLENRASFYGDSGCCILALDPEFRTLRTTGRDKCFVYSYKQPPGSLYSSQPKQEGIGFGGVYGKQRVWLDNDFLSVTVRHHAVDKTYRSGNLVPGQGYAAVEGKVLGVEVWGLGGLAADEKQTAYQKRQNVFLDQRRKVDLKAFGTWEDSPEKLMLNLVSDPAKVDREDR